MRNRIFFPQTALDEWMFEGSADLRGNELVLLAEAKRYALEEAARVVRVVEGGDEKERLIGKVKTKGALEAMGAELSHESMILGDLAYDIVPGWLATPVFLPTDS